MKSFAKQFIIKILGWQLRRLRKRHDFEVVAVAGSVGKTTTKHVIARYLKSSKNVHYQTGNYNVPLTVPLVFFDEIIPPLLNPIAWVSLLLRNERKIRDHYPYEIVVVELGIDCVGEMDQFAKYLKPDVAVLTSITHEHMEFFVDLDEVAREELKILSFSRMAVIGLDDIPNKYHSIFNDSVTYGITDRCDYRLIGRQENITIKSKNKTIQSNTNFIGAHVQKTFAAAVAVADLLNIEIQKPGDVIASIDPMPGRMQLLDGRNNSRIIDDTYNNVSQVPLKAALDVLYGWHATRRIAIIGNMNELGEYSKKEHEDVGHYCDPKKIDLLITIGPHANTHLANMAEKKGCNVMRFDSPYKIGEFMKQALSQNTIVLVKGSQNKVYLEEAIKPMLANASDHKKLVRQSPEWLNKKQKQFSSI